MDGQSKTLLFCVATLLVLRSREKADGIDSDLYLVRQNLGVFAESDLTETTPRFLANEFISLIPERSQIFFNLLADSLFDFQGGSR